MHRDEIVSKLKSKKYQDPYRSSELFVKNSRSFPSAKIAVN